MLATAILKTIRYFDVQDHCLTLVDISKFLLNAEGLHTPISMKEILDELNGSLANEVSESNGFYFLKGREGLVKKRLENNIYATPRLKRMKRYLPFMRHIPYIVAVGVGGSEALANSKKGSDIDLLVLTKKNRIWLARLFITTYFQILGMRRRGNLIANRFCLNHYIAEDKELAEDHNLYTAVEYTSLIPFYGGEALNLFQEKNLPWISRFLAQPVFVRVNTPKPSKLKLVMEKVLDKTMANYLERFVGRLQRNKIIIQEHIIVTEDELSFHPGSKGRQVLARFE